MLPGHTLFLSAFRCDLHQSAGLVYFPVESLRTPKLERSHTPFFVFVSIAVSLNSVSKLVVSITPKYRKILIAVRCRIYLSGR